MDLKSSFFITLSPELNASNLLGGFTMFQSVEMAIGPTNLQSTYITLHRVENQLRKPLFQVNRFITQYAQRAPEDFVTTAIFPQLIGLAWDTTMKPLFSTKIAEHTSGKETRTSFWENPKWDFTLTYDYLPNKEAGVTDLKRMLGFFLERSGSFEEFLFKAPNFNRQVNHDLMVGDGKTVEVVAVAEIDGYLMPVGYIDSTDCTLWIEQTQRYTISPTATIQLTYPYNAVVSGVHRDIETFTRVTGAPGWSEYNFDEDTGLLTFNAGRANTTNVDVNYKGEMRLGTEFDILYPRTFVFNTAPADGALVSGTYSFYFICRFLDDEAEFAQFSDKLWNLQEINIRSIIE